VTDLQVRPYSEKDRERWDDLVDRSRSGTFMHRRGFLETVAQGVVDRSLLVVRAGRLVGVLPAAEHPSDPHILESHPSSGGGLLHDPGLPLPALLAAFTAVAEHCYHEGFDTLRYKSLPGPYHRQPSQADTYALFRLGAALARCELASFVDTGSPRDIARHRRRHLRRAQRAGLEVLEEERYLREFWTVLEDRLAGSHRATPQHRLEEVIALRQLFPQQVSCVVARDAGRVVAGAVVFRTGQVDQTPYLAADDRGYDVSALDLVVENVISDAARRGVRFVSLGPTTTYGGRHLNEGLHRYKAEFGAGDVVHLTYDLPLG
jgi:hypothetical protein